MKCMLDGKQVAILVPTTVLAQQHYLTAMRRFATFQSPSTCSPVSAPLRRDQKTLFDLQSGKIDLIVGTHKLLQKDIHFHDLGLLIVDEEQRFGVTHKERLKRTFTRRGRLNTVRNAHPAHAQYGAVGGFVTCPPSNSRRRTAILCRRLCLSTRTAFSTRRSGVNFARGGQVYYLHNRVESIDQCAAKIKQRIPRRRSLSRTAK